MEVAPEFKGSGSRSRREGTYRPVSKLQQLSLVFQVSSCMPVEEGHETRDMPDWSGLNHPARRAVRLVATGNQNPPQAEFLADKTGHKKLNLHRSFVVLSVQAERFRSNGS